MNCSDLSEKLFREGYNCAQSVFGAFADVVGLDQETAMKIASPFGAGFGKLREMCGAVSGITLVLGYIDGYSDKSDFDGKKRLYQKTQNLINDFKSEMGTYICRELLHLKEGEDLEEPAVRDENYYSSRPCIKCCRVASMILEKYLADNNEISKNFNFSKDL